MTDSFKPDETPAQSVWRDAVAFWLEAGSILTTSMTFALWALQLHLPHARADHHVTRADLMPPAGEGDGDHGLFA